MEEFNKRDGERRTDYFAEVRISVGKKPYVDVEFVDLSPGGLAFVSDMQLQVGEVISTSVENVSMIVKGKSIVNDLCFKTAATITSAVDASSNKYKYGVKFDDLNNDIRTRISVINSRHSPHTYDTSLE